MNKEENNTPKWYKALSLTGSAVFIIAVIAWNWNVIKTSLLGDDVASIEKATSELIEESLAKTEDLKKFARVCSVKEVSLVKEGSSNSYKGYATVIMQARKKGSSDDNIVYGGNPIDVQYSLSVIYDGQKVMLDNAEMMDNDWSKILAAVGVQSNEDSSDESSSDLDQSTPEKTAESFLNIVSHINEDYNVDDFIKLSADLHGRKLTKLQKSNLQKAITNQQMEMADKIVGNIIRREMTLEDGRVQVAVSVTDSDGKTTFDHIVVKKIGDKWYITE